MSPATIPRASQLSPAGWYLNGGRAPSSLSSRPAARYSPYTLSQRSYPHIKEETPAYTPNYFPQSSCDPSYFQASWKATAGLSGSTWASSSPPGAGQSLLPPASSPGSSSSHSSSSSQPSPTPSSTLDTLTSSYTDPALSHPYPSYQHYQPYYAASETEFQYNFPPTYNDYTSSLYTHPQLHSHHPAAAEALQSALMIPSPLSPPAVGSAASIVAAKCKDEPLDNRELNIENEWIPLTPPTQDCNV